MEMDPAFAPRPAWTSERVLRLITRGVNDFAIVVVDADGRIVHWNEGAVQLFGYDEGEALGLSTTALFVPEDVEAGRPVAELRAARELGHAEDENWLRRKDGSRFWALGSTSAVKEPAGEVEAYIKVVRDASSKKPLEDEMRRLNASLEDRVRARTSELQEAVNEMGAFSYSIAHDLRAPLRAMTGFAELLKDELGTRLSGDARDYLRRIHDSAIFMNRMIDDLLVYSRVTRAEVLCHPLDPTAILEQVVNELEAPIEASRAEIHLERPLPRVLAHEVTLAQVFHNLLTNALKFVRPGETPRIRVAGERRDGWVRIWVEDRGIGVPPEHARRIFGIFERLHPASAYAGTGIGLAIVNRGLERMKGRVGVEPNPGGGSRFWIELRPATEGVESKSPSD